MNNTTRSLSILLIASLAVPLYAGRYPLSGTQTFTYPDSTRTMNDTAPGGATALISSSAPVSFAAVEGNAMRLCKAGSAGNAASFRVGDLDSGKAIQSFDATFTVKMKKAAITNIPGSGWALNFGPIPVSGDGAGDLGYTLSNGLVVSFDTFRSSPSDVPSIEVYANNVSVGNFAASSLTGAVGVTSASFTLTNPVTGASTGILSATSSAASVQTSMRAVAGWNAVLVTGPAGGPWLVDHVTLGAYANPTLGTLISSSPGGSGVIITNPQDGTPTTSEKWQVKLDGPGFAYDDTFRTVSIHWDYSGLDMTYDGQVIFENLPTPGFVPSTGHKFAFTASGLGASQDTFFDDMVLSTSPILPLETGGPVISEFMAENASGLEDEDMDTPDWIEIYNGQNTDVDLSGYKLTDGTATWTFPSRLLPKYSYIVVLASGKNKTPASGYLHTNFTLQKEGGNIKLKSPADAIRSDITYGDQKEDISFGINFTGTETGYVMPSTPGSAALYDHFSAPNGPAEDVAWSRAGGLITGSTAITIAPPVAPNSVVRYTTDNTLPTPYSAIYTGPITVSASTNLRARVFTAGYLPGDVTSRTFLMLDQTLANYNNSGSEFKSHLPLIVLDSFGVSVDSVTGSASLRPFRYSYAVAIDKDATGWASITSPTPNFEGRAATHVRGESSSGFPQLSYALELWDNKDQDKDSSLLGMPPESDWVLYGPYTDKTLMRNLILFQKMRELHGGLNGYAMRTRFVEVFFNQTAGAPISYGNYRGVYVLMEKIKRNKDRVDIAKLTDLVTDPNLITGGYIFKRDKISADGNTGLAVSMQAAEPEHLNTPQLNYLNGFINGFNNALNGGNFTDPVLGYAPYINRDSFIENQWFVEIAKQIDGYRLSTYFYKDRGNVPLRASPLWDYNLSLSNADYLTGENPTGWYYTQLGSGDYYWWPRLLQDPNYLTRHWDRYWEMRRSIFETSSIRAFIDQQASLILNGSTTPVTNSMTLPAGQPATAENAAMRQFRKYPILGVYVWPNSPGYGSRTAYNSNGATANGEVDFMKEWLTTRLAWIDNQYTSGSLIYRPPNFSNYGGNVSAGTQITITPYNGTPPAGFTYAQPGTIYYTLDGTDPRPGSTGGGVPGEVVLLNAGAQCKWLVPSGGNGGFGLTAGAGPSQWTTYTDPPNIANWTSGTTGVGYERDPASATSYVSLIGTNANTESQMYGINGTCYMRVAFNIPDQATLDAINTFKLSIKYDDGFRAYINGTFVAGRNDTDVSMTNDPSTAVANQIHDDAAAINFEDIDISGVGKPALRIGANVLAIHGLNSPNTSSDLVFVPKLSYIPPTGGGGGGNGFVYSGPITLNGPTVLKARLFSNGFWTPITTASYVVDAVPASAANIVISELMYNPLPPTPNESNAGYGDNDFEYIELRNISAASVDLTGCKFTAGVNYDFNLSDPATLTLPAGGRIVIVANTGGFAMRYNPAPGTKIVGPYTGSLSNQGETLTLKAKNDSIIASFEFVSHGEWPDIADGHGSSLVLNNPTGLPDYNNAANWRSSAVVGGTPGGVDSLPFTGSLTGDTDGDGYVDYLEYATGSNANDNASRNAPTLDLATYTVGSVPAKYLRFIFRRGLNADGFSMTPELTTDQLFWKSSAAEITFVGSTHNADGTDNIEYRSTQPASTLPHASMRLKVTSQP